MTRAKVDATLHLSRHVALMARVEGAPGLLPIVPLYFGRGNVRFQFPTQWEHTGMYTNLGGGAQIPLPKTPSRMAPVYKVDFGGEYVRPNDTTFGVELGGGAVHVEPRTGWFPHLEARVLLGYQF